jgi:hypothetical protein
MHLSSTIVMAVFASSVHGVAYPQSFSSFLEGLIGSIKAHGSKPPGGKAPGSTAPGSTAPGSTAPGSQPPGSTAPGSCPAVWTQISADLKNMFVSGGQCNDDARASIRAVFHDCFPQGGCDGSIAIPEELARPENAGMTSTINKLVQLAKSRGVGVADMLMFAGCKFDAPCSVELVRCVIGGPTC